jgi:uncharacterized protein (TIGR03435 family)
MQEFVLLRTVIAVALFLFEPSSAQKLGFEVASIKLNTSERDGGSMGPSGDRFLATNVTLKSLMNFAFHPSSGPLLHQQIIGGPAWINTDHFDVQAKFDTSAGPVTPEQLQLMLQVLLEDRFQLKAHRERRELPVYELAVTRGGPKLSEDQTPPNSGVITFTSGEALQSDPLPRGAVRVVRGPSSSTLSAAGIRMSLLVNLLQGQSDRIIVDKTDVQGLFDVHLQFTDVRGLDSSVDPALGLQAPPETPGASLFTAIQEIGLKMESGKAALDVVVIDSVRRPSEN